MTGKQGFYDEDEAGPPTPEDDMWFHEHVRAAGYPKVKRDPKPMPGQMPLLTYTKDQPPVCGECDGVGWVLDQDHAPECWNTGNCERHGCPVQVQVACSVCGEVETSD